MKTILIVLLAVSLGMSAPGSVNRGVRRYRGCPVQGQLFFRRCRPCVGTCENPRPICPLVCTRGCACPRGTVLDTDANACVSPKQCTTGRACKHSDGTKIKDGESYQPNPCTTCRCDSGKLFCTVQDCAAPNCDDYYVPTGECCPVCPEPTPVTLPPKCAAVLCLAVDCPGAVIPEGECCAVCPEPTLPPKVCEYNGQVYQPGDSFPASDGCNTCSCSENGFVACTKRACISKLVCPKPTGFGICVELCVPGLPCGPGQKCCSNGCGHVCTNATDCALVDCAPTQCDFTGGAVIPAGEDECCPTCGCMSGGTTYRVGESFPAGDGCNGCSCTSSGILCTLIACKEPVA